LVGKVTSKGRDGPTRADQNKALVVLKILQGQQVLFDDPWVKNLWFPPNGIMTWSDSQVSTHVVTVPETPQRPLNTSQIYAIEKMLSFKTEDHIILLRGPPGSGKTSVISRFVEIATASEHYPGIWLIAQSNIAVKNIAEKLVSVGYMKWRLLVSKDFIFDWHEHLYDAKFRDNVISSEKFFALSMSKISDSKVILCTLSMFSNFFISKFTKHIPIHTLIVDEASQIEVGSFLSVLISASKTLQKLCLIGDDKQLPPYGQEEIQDLKSVFEIDHLQNHLYLLDTQYRMPPQMGDFISNTVYNGELKSNSKHAINDKTIACQFIDAGGVERSERDSYIVSIFSDSLVAMHLVLEHENTTEASAVIKLAAFLQTSGKSYRIVTPYDSQRNHIEELMKGQGLSWHDKCFNVDSFQGWFLLIWLACFYPDLLNPNYRK
ncbi:P-loop containing nucleoside triphosphate hydrolase protein, partial [Lentinula aciculospora]